MKVAIKLIVLIFINIAISLKLLPYLQFESNSHSLITDYLTLLLFVFGLGILIYEITKIVSRKFRLDETFISILFS